MVNLILNMGRKGGDVRIEVITNIIPKWEGSVKF